MSKILVADDEAPMREMISLACRMEGHTVAQAADTGSTVAAYASLLPDLMILDLAMPGGGGLFVARQLRAVIGTLCPIVVVSGFVGTLSEEERSEIGAAVILEKPFSIEALRSAVRRALASGAR